MAMTTTPGWSNNPPGATVPPPTESTYQAPTPGWSNKPPTATGATAGTPGTWTPAGAVVPANLAAMSGITASPATAWTTGQRMVLGDASLVHWSGTAWVVGAA
jgi:hypothetical protein